ncbi:type I-E CRISPR-associated protein Cas7/Cse4/CasC [Oceanospirillum linum]|uniref:Type I-E CRISPR-associated protein Cas7/Cse4/CasC n=1 Tax=Oceanospirillum linum TaxID=966 RepID=A0A1T1H920_OCELI|nr:type I-E CRISPR-associated protein Cas7/Cse4/CasC [Oceanospirillum linum]OOV86276.1 type I-E CRISPR-associated protein Cas7/Cse4/CasC [Oceanospirillum linum]SEG52496.1 CRISPR-associated protein, Cse4 family [Oleiphilus messinensis]SMP30539.1 CRISPR-associated protein, Cse4 family [Oceanospirillum linum]
MSKNFINFHVLISHSPSCLNRDDMNMQKSAIFGGKRRVRVSSQSLKRTMRQGEYYKKHLGEPSLRTRELAKVQQHYVDALKDSFSEEIVISALEAISGKEGLPDLSSKGIAVAPWVISEVAYFCQLIEDSDEADIGKLKKRIEKDSKSAIAAASQAIDIALSGRMATSGLMTNIDGALAVAHALTTHAVDADIDWFTAVDDIVQDEKVSRRVGALEEGKGESGSGHLDTQEFSSGVFYRYASLNIAQLQENLGNAPREKALDIAAHVLHMLATEVPSAKQQSYAAHNLADQALVSFSDQPISLANAFETPVKADHQGGFREPSAKKLNEYWDKIHRGYGLDERCAEFSLEPIELPTDMLAQNSLPALEAWVRADGPIDNDKQ